MRTGIDIDVDIDTDIGVCAYMYIHAVRNTNRMITQCRQKCKNAGIDRVKDVCIYIYIYIYMYTHIYPDVEI